MNTPGQSQDLVLTFSCIDNTDRIQPDSIKIMNRCMGSDTVLVYPDTVLVIGYTGMNEITGEIQGFSSQVFPNPVQNSATLSLDVPADGLVTIMVCDLMGKQVLHHEQYLFRGRHFFSLNPGQEMIYLLTAVWNGVKKTIKIVNTSNRAGTACTLKYSGYEIGNIPAKSFYPTSCFEYCPGDTLLYISYADSGQSGILDVPECSETFIMQHATNIPCPGIPTVSYEGQVYNTIQLFGQCWLKENLNAGTMISGSLSMSDNGILEKYCYNDDPDSCSKYGGLYQWPEAMQYSNQPGTQGICPPGWHIPTDEEWKVQNASADNYYGIGDPEWDTGDSLAWNGLNAGANLKTSCGWTCDNGTDKYGFSWLPSGIRFNDGNYYLVRESGPLWSSTKSLNNPALAWCRNLAWYQITVGRWQENTGYGFSVRCLKDD